MLALLGEMTAASALLSASLKYEGSVTLQIHGDGPVRLAVAECMPTWACAGRSACERCRHWSLGHPSGAHQPVGAGRFSLILDPMQPHQQPYQGIVSFVGESLSAAMESYMMQSEQLPSRLWLFAQADGVAGLLLQQMPQEGGSGAGQHPIGMRPGGDWAFWPTPCVPRN